MRLLLADYSAPEIGDLFEQLELDEQLKILRNLDIEDAVDIFACLEIEQQLALMSEFRQERAVHFLQEMDPDDRTDLLQRLPDEAAQALFEKLPEEDQKEVSELIRYEESSAGGIMTTEYACVPSDVSAGEALEIIRSKHEDIEMSWYVYVVDDEKRLAGILTLQKLLLNPPDTPVEEFMMPHPIKATHDMDQEDVAREMVKYDLLAMPVVDYQDHMLGIVTFDDVARVIEDEATEDYELFGGVIASDETYDKASIWGLVKERLPWLAILLLLGSLNEFVVSYYAGKIDLGLMAILTGFFPMVQSTAGNAGTQSAVIIIRGIATGEINYRAIGLVFGKEVLVGLALGLLIGLLAFARVALFNHQMRLIVSVVAGSTILIQIFFSTMFGALLPMIVKRIGLDPATMSSPLITTTVDLLTAAVYLNMAIIVSHMHHM